MSAKKAISVKAARDKMVAAAERYAMCYGEAQRINGVRARQDSDDLFRREMQQWNRVGELRVKFVSALRGYRTAILASRVVK